MTIKALLQRITSNVLVLPLRVFKHKFKLIGVTGTDGKTTTSTLIYNMLKKGKRKVALITTIGLFIDKEFIPTGLHTTTPSATFIWKMLHKVKNFDFVVIEVSSHAIDQGRIAGLPFDTIVYTNITRDHLDYHKNWNNYANTKANLRFHINRKTGIAIINVDDRKSYKFLKKKLAGYNVMSYGIYHNADIRAFHILKDSFDVKSNKINTTFKTNLFGEYNISNSLAAIACVLRYDVSLKCISAVISDFPKIPGRFDIVSYSPLIFVDFAHTANAIYNVLASVSYKKEGNSKIITVFGAPGERDKLKRPNMGKAASKFSDIIVITADDPRYESLDNIFNDITKKIDKNKFKLNKNLFKIDARGDAIRFALKIANKHDIVAVLGKGHEESLSIKGKEYHWNDKNFIKKLLG
jgi:UDP-N-acetylmuramyl-tripeptide synthetase